MIEIDACYGTLCLLSDSCTGTAEIAVAADGASFTGSAACLFDGGLASEGAQVAALVGTISTSSGAITGTVTWADGSMLSDEYLLGTITGDPATASMELAGTCAPSGFSAGSYDASIEVD